MKTKKEAVIAAVFHPDKDHVLLIKRRDLPVWAFPGGGISDGETPEECVIREVFEETGFRVTIKRKVADYTPINRWTDRTHLFECCVVGGQATTGEETREVVSYPINKLPEMLFVLHREWLLDVQKNLSETMIKPIDAPFTRVFSFAFSHPILFLRYLLSRMGCPINQ